MVLESTNQINLVLFRNKSFTFRSTCNNNDEYNSPTVNLEGANALFYENRLNEPIEDYRTDPRVKSRFNDPHASYYLSNPIYIKNLQHH